MVVGSETGILKKALITSFGLVSCLIFTDAAASVRHYKWEVKYNFKYPDCVKKLAITINNEFPGPAIVAQQGDTIVVEIVNFLVSENIGMHWHGIKQRGTPWFDGTEGVTQCPILPGETFVYRFVVDQPGSYMYHGHYGFARQVGLYGFIHVALPDGQLEPFSYDFDQNIILTDWYHKSIYEQAAGLYAIPFVWVGEPQSILINGRGKFDCYTPGLESGICNGTHTECSPYTLTVIPGKTYRLRIGSLTALSALSFEIEGHTMTVVEADGHNVEPFVVKNLFIYSGETYSVLIKANQNPSRNYWISAKVVTRNSTTPQGLGILNYNKDNPRRNPLTRPPVGPHWNDVRPRLSQSLSVKARQGFVPPPPQTSDRVIMLLNTQIMFNGYLRWAINNVTFNLPALPYLVAFKKNMMNAFDQTAPPEEYDKNYDIFGIPENKNGNIANGVYRLKFNTTVDVILQNANSLTPNMSETHPWHLHGHNFWVLGYGLGKFDKDRDTKKFNLVNPILKNTVAVHPYGWTAFRFVADNPGVWAFHCHIDSHLFMGMGIIFEEGVERVADLPASVLGCEHPK